MIKNLNRQQVEDLGGRLVSVDGEYIVAECLGGAFTLNLMKGDISLTPSIATHFFWESWITSWFTNNIETGMRVFDVGANCGYFTALFEKLGAEVVAYECNPAYVDLLRRSANDFKYNYMIRPVALDEHPGEVVLSYPGDYTGSASIMTDFKNTQWGEDKHITVPATTLNDEVKQFGIPDLIKIDAESAEEVIWNGGRDLWSSEFPPVVVLEYSPTGTYSAAFDEELFDTGYVTRIDYDGTEKSIGIDWLHQLKDWDMIVWRSK